MRRDVVVLPLRAGMCQNLDLALAHAESTVERRRMLRRRLRVRQEYLRRARLDDDVTLRAPDDFADRLTREDDGGVLLAKRPEPLLDFLAEERVSEHYPRLVDHEKRRSTRIESLIDPVKHVEQHRDEILLAHVHEVLHLEDLKACGSERVCRRIEESAERSAECVMVEPIP